MNAQIENKVIGAAEIVEEYDLDPVQGAAAMFVHCRKPGYRLKELIREGRKVTVTYVKQD